MDMINRSAIVVKPAQPFLDWLHRVDPTSEDLTLHELRREPTIYLLPEWETDEEALEHLRELSNSIFEEQLNGWYRVPAAWPSERDLNAFLRWFECSFHSMVMDLATNPSSMRRCEPAKHIAFQDSELLCEPRSSFWTVRDCQCGEWSLDEPDCPEPYRCQ